MGHLAVVLRGLWVPRDHRDQRASPDLQDHPVSQDHRDSPGLPDLAELTAVRDSPVRPALQECPAFLVHKEAQVRRDRSVLQDLPEFRDRLEVAVNRVSRDH